jgi:hypothetical protein
MDSHRRRGLASALLRVAIEHMRTGDAAGSLLYGIDDFYEPFGWRSWGDERWVRVAIGDPSDSVDDDHGARPMRDDDREAVARSYEQIAARVPGAAARTCGRAWAQLDVADVTVVERDGVIVGWAWFGRDRVAERDAKQARVPAEVVVAELQAVDEQAMLDVVAVARKRARLDGERPDATMLVVGAPEAHPLRVLARAGRIECALVDEVRLTGGPMLLPFDERGEALAAIAAPYQFLPDRF